MINRVRIKNSVQTGLRPVSTGPDRSGPVSIGPDRSGPVLKRFRPVLTFWTQLEFHEIPIDIVRSSTKKLSDVFLNCLYRFWINFELSEKIENSQTGPDQHKTGLDRFFMRFDNLRTIFGPVSDVIFNFDSR